MACGLSRSEIKEFNISLDENQRCQAILPGGERICNSLLTDHTREKIASTKDVLDNETTEDVVDSHENSTCCGRFGKRFLHTAQVVVVSYMMAVCFLVLLISGINFYVNTSSISNLMIDFDVDSLQFWYSSNRIGLNAYAYNDNGRTDIFYTHSSYNLEHYNCGGDVDCEETVDALSDAWNTLVLASSLSAFLCVVSWLLSAPRSFYPCFYNTMAIQNGLKDEKKAFVWFLKPVALTYVLSLLYALVFGIQFVSLFKYLGQLPNEQDMYRLFLDYINSDNSLCSFLSPCEVSYESIYSYNRNFVFLIVALDLAAVSIILTIFSHRLKLQSIKWECFARCCACNGQGKDSIPVEIEETEVMVCSAPPQAAIFTVMEVQRSEADLSSKC